MALSMWCAHRRWLQRRLPVRNCCGLKRRWMDGGDEPAVRCIEAGKCTQTSCSINGCRVPLMSQAVPQHWPEDETRRTLVSNSSYSFTRPAPSSIHNESTPLPCTDARFSSLLHSSSPPLPYLLWALRLVNQRLDLHDRSTDIDSSIFHER